MFIRKSKKRIISLLAVMMMIFTMVPAMAFAGTDTAKADGLYIYIDGNDVTGKQVTCYYAVDHTVEVKLVKDGVMTDVPLSDVTVEQSVTTASVSGGTLTIDQTTQLGNISDFIVKYDGKTAKTSIYTGVLITEFTQSGSPVDALNVNCGTDLKFNMSYAGGNNAALGQYIKQNYKVEVKAGDADRSEYFTKFAAGQSSGKITITVNASKPENLVFLFSLDGKTLSCNITVNVDRIAFTEKSVVIDPEETIELGYELAKGLNPSDIAWNSDNENVVTVSDGKITGVKNGTATVSATIGGKTEICKVTVLADGVYGLHDINSLNVNDLIGPYNDGINLNGPEDKTGYITVWKNGKKLNNPGYRIAVKSDNSSVVKDDGDGAGNFVPVANGTANLYVFEENTTDGVSNLLYVIPVTVTGMEDDAEENTWEPYPGAQKSSSSIEMLEPGKEYIQTDTTNSVTFENMIIKEMPAQNAEFVLELVNVPAKASGGGTGGVSYPEEALQLVQSDTFKSDYLNNVKEYIYVVDENGNVLATAENGLEIGLEEIGAKKTDAAEHFYADLKVTVTKDLEKNTEYKLIVGALIPVPGVHANIGEAYKADYGRVRVETSYAFVTEKGDVADVTVSDIPAQTYTGSEIKPAIEVKDGDTVLVEGTDYTVEYTNNIEVGIATATIKGIGDYTGTTTKNFNIVSADLPFDPDGDDADKNDKDNKDDATQTGDDANMASMLALMIAALLTAGAAVVRRREN